MRKRENWNFYEHLFSWNIKDGRIDLVYKRRKGRSLFYFRLIKGGKIVSISPYVDNICKEAGVLIEIDSEVRAKINSLRKIINKNEIRNKK